MPAPPVRPILARVWTAEMRMVCLSFLILYLELSLIRWVPGYVHNFGYFTNFAMLAAFLGIGVGCLLAGRVALVGAMPSLLVALALVVRFSRVELVLASTRTAAFWGEPTGEGLHNLSTTSGVVGLFTLLTLVFVGPGQLLGSLFGSLPRLRAYGLNVAGGLAGILVFAVHSRLDHPPIVWFAVAALLAAPFLAAAPRRLWPVNAALLAAFLFIVHHHTQGETWSPYYRHTIERKDGTIWLFGNGVPGIGIADWVHLPSKRMYAMPYGKDLHALRKQPDAPIRRALIIGCGAGNEVAVALRSGVQHVDAVDINPWVIEVGRELHPLQPFAAERVATFVADGREFLARKGDPYDLIVYGLPDSTFTNDRANLRVESFLFTREAFDSALSRLSPDGVFVIYNYYRVPWLVEKLHGMLREASGQEPFTSILYPENLGVGMAVGPGLALSPALRDPSPAAATDDWPFLYLVGPSIPRAYLDALAAVALLTLALVPAALRLGRAPKPGDRAMESGLVLATLFFMGAAFVLLETRSVVTFGLFFGSTWWNNVVVFAAIHVSVLMAVMVNVRFRDLPRSAMAALLLGSLAVAWWLPPETLLVGSRAVRTVLAGAVAFLPIFFANVLFARIFGETREGRVSYAFNLLGGILGGLLEYASLLIGYQALVGLATLFYLLALLFAYRHSVRNLEAS